MNWISFKDKYPSVKDLEKIDNEYVCLIYTKNDEWFPRNIKHINELKNDAASGYYTHWLLVKAPI